jgi:hypothetical protein
MITFHVGLHKTGSSSVQLALSEGNLITNRRYFYFTRPRTDHSDDPLQREVAHRLRRLARSTQVVISDEGFFGSIRDVYSHLPQRAGALKDLYGNEKWRIVIYLRPQLDWIRSAFAQEVKFGHCQPPEDFARALLNREYFSWARIVAELGELVGFERLLVRPYRSRMNVTEDFFDLCNLGPVPEHVSRTRSNVSLDTASVALLHTLNPTMGSVQRARVRNALERSQPRSVEDEPMSLFTADIEREIDEFYRSDWSNLAALMAKTSQSGEREFRGVLERTPRRSSVHIPCDLADPRVSAAQSRLHEHLHRVGQKDPWQPSTISQVQQKWSTERGDMHRALIRRLARRR